MKLESAFFVFTHPAAGRVRIAFGTGTVTVSVGGKTHVAENPNKYWKPCATHCKELTRQALAGELD